MTTNPPARYVCINGFDYEGGKTPVRVDADEMVPKRLPAKVVADLLEHGDIAEAVASDG